MRTKSMSDANSATGQSSGETNDARRVWLWWFLALLTAWQFYFVRELLAALAVLVIADREIA